MAQQGRDASSLLVGVTLLFIFACDGQREGMAAAPKGESRASSSIHESCTHSGDCKRGLRCVDQVCARVERSRLGDLLAAAGRASLRKGNIAEAIEFYNRATTQYERDALEAPLDVVCEQGRALTAARMDPQKAEAAARVLHRCVLMAAPGSRRARSAHDELAKLMDVGLDPELIRRGEPADLYLTKEPKRPSLDKLELEVKGDPRNRRKSHAAVVEGLAGDDVKAELAACWEAYWEATQKKRLAVRVPISYRYILHEDDPALDRIVLKVEDADADGDADQMAASSCVRSTVQETLKEIAKSVREDARWKAELKIRIGH